jgi:predicted RNase H-like nuclease (RuvC/YqgF family)
MSDTSWIKPGMYVTVDRGPQLASDSGQVVFDNTGDGEVFKVKAVDLHYVACEHLRGSGCSENIVLDARRYDLRELSPSYVEAMTGEKVDGGTVTVAAGEWERLRKEVEQLTEERGRHHRDADHCRALAARLLLESEKLRKELEQAKKERDAERNAFRELRKAEAKLAAIRKEIESC